MKPDTATRRPANPADKTARKNAIKEQVARRLRVTYHAGLLRVSEWICLDHPGYAGDKARAWWHQRFPSQPPTVNEALGFLFLPQQILAVTESIEVGRDGKYPTIKTATIRRTV